MGRHQRGVAGIFRGNVFWQFEMDRAGPLFGGDAKSVANQRGNRGGTHDLLRLFCQRTHRRDDIDDLEMRLRALADGLLAGDQHHRHAAEKTVGSTCDEVERTGAERGECNPRPSREPSISGCEKSRRLLVARHHELDGGAPEAFDDVEILLPGHPEDSIDALVLERSDEKIRSLHVRYPLWIKARPQKFRVPHPGEIFAVQAGISSRVAGHENIAHSAMPSLQKCPFGGTSLDAPEFDPGQAKPGVSRL